MGTQLVKGGTIGDQLGTGLQDRVLGCPGSDSIGAFNWGQLGTGLQVSRSTRACAPLRDDFENSVGTNLLETGLQVSRVARPRTPRCDEFRNLVLRARVSDPAITRSAWSFRSAGAGLRSVTRWRVRRRAGVESPEAGDLPLLPARICGRAMIAAGGHSEGLHWQHEGWSLPRHSSAAGICKGSNVGIVAELATASRYEIRDTACAQYAKLFGDVPEGNQAFFECKPCRQSALERSALRTD